MDRSANLRLLMKKSQPEKSTSLDTLSGKEKAKILKMLKEKKKSNMSENFQEKNNQTLPPSGISQQGIKNTNISKPVKQISSLSLNSTSQVKSTPEPSKLPTNFFDIPDVEEKSVAVSKEEDVDHIDNDVEIQNNTEPSVVEYNDPNLSQPTPDATPTEISHKSGLPQGFFDNMYEDYQARGLDLKEEIKKKEELQKQELESFLEQIENIEEDFVEENEEQEQEKQIEEEAINFAYLAKVATLYQERISLKRKKEHQYDMIDISHLPSSDKANSVEDVKEVEALLRLETDADLGGEDEMNKNKIEEDVLLAMRKTKERKRLKQKSRVDDIYAPLDFSDWTAKSLR